MNWLDRLERRFERYGIPNLIDYVIIGQVIVFGVTWLINSRVSALLTLSRAALLHGQVWRVLTFLFVPESLTSILGFVISAYFYWMIGRALEREWGTGRFTLYFLFGMAGALAACLLTGYASNYSLFLSMFLAFAMLYPNMEVLLFFVLPIKVKWLGIVAGGMWLLGFVVNSFTGKVSDLLCMAGFLVYFAPSLVSNIRAWYRREQWKRNNRGGWR